MLCIYSGGDSGFQERDALLTWLKELDPRKISGDQDRLL